MGYTAETLPVPEGLQLLGPLHEGYQNVLTFEALEFLAALARTYTKRAEELLEERSARQQRFDAGERPCFLEHTESVRERDWTVAPLPQDLREHLAD